MPRPKVYDAELRDALIATTAEAIAAGGAQAVSVRRVAEEAGTTTNAVYTLFGGRSELLEAVAARAAQSFTQAQQGVGETTDAAEDLTRLGDAYRRWASAHPQLYTVMFGTGLVGPPQGEPDESVRPLVRAVERLVAAGVFRPEPVDVIVHSIWAAVHGAVSLELTQGDGNSSAEHRYRAHCDAIARGWRVSV